MHALLYFLSGAYLCLCLNALGEIFFCKASRATPLVVAAATLAAQERDAVLDEEERQKHHHGALKGQMARWAGAMNSTFKALSVDLEGLGVYGGRVTADADLVMLMGVVEAKVIGT
jgi:hypothetical protein